MIKLLRVRNLATIEDLEIGLQPGFSILTGETGAGKSIIIDAIRLILGDKGSPDLVRTGKAEAFVEAVFDTTHGTVDLAGLQSGSLQVVATDHCAFTTEQKRMGRDDFTKIPNGLPGVGDRLPILWTYGVRAGRLTPNQFVALTATQPAQIMGLYPRKGTLAPGADADVLIWDPEKQLTYGVAHAQHRIDYNLYEGWKLTGYPEKVFLRGQLIVDGEQWLGRRGQGRYLRRGPFNEVR